MPRESERSITRLDTRPRSSNHGANEQDVMLWLRLLCCRPSRRSAVRQTDRILMVVGPGSLLSGRAVTMFNCHHRRLLCAGSTSHHRIFAPPPGCHTQHSILYSLSLSCIVYTLFSVLCRLSSSFSVYGSEVTVTSLRPPRLCRLAVFSIKPTLLSGLQSGGLARLSPDPPRGQGRRQAELGV